MPPSPDPSNGITAVYTITPHCPYEIKSQAQTLINRIKIDRGLVHPVFRPYLDRTIRGLLPTLFDVLLPSAIWKSEAIVLAARKKLTGTAAQKGVIITVRDREQRLQNGPRLILKRARKAWDRARKAIFYGLRAVGHPPVGAGTITSR